MTVPEGWVVKPIKELAEIYSGGTPNTKKNTYWNGNIVWITPSDLTNQKKMYVFFSERRITKDGLSNSSAMLMPKGTLLLCSRATIGDISIAGGPLATNQGFKNLICFENVDNIFLYYAILPLKNKMIEQAVGTTFLEISKTALEGIEVLLPVDKSEQHAIAEVLSDMDGYIASLERLIAKKRAIKQGAMQELLTGKRRLPGFTGEWVEKKINGLGIFISGNGFPIAFQGEHIGLPFYKVSDFNNGGNETTMDKANNYITNNVADLLNCNIIPRNSIIFAKIGAAIFLERKRMVLHDCYIDNNMMAFLADDNKVFAEYIFCLLQTIKFGDLITATALPSLSSKAIGEVARLFPPTIPEQSAIASILSDMDTEIEALTAKLNKAKLIKQGMMQELLTGRIRLIKQKVTSVPVAKFAELPKHEKLVKGHNQAIEDAVILAVITDLYATEQYPLAPFYSQKLPYLLHRHIEGKVEGYKKQAAGPYNPTYRYRTALPIAQKNKYVIGIKATYKGNFYLNLVVGNNIDEAKNYFEKWHGEEPLKWLEQFRYIKNRRDELELLTTVDMAMVELRNSNKPVTVFSVKEIIQNSSEWNAKLKREIFSDENILRAIAWSIKLFGEEE
jgi:type I restriction enzyme S subunit